MLNNFLRDCLKDMVPYKVEPYLYEAKLDANESPQDIPLKIRQILAKEILDGVDLNRYPDTDALELRRMLAQKLLLNIDQLIIGSGSDELLQMIVNAYIDKGDTALYPSPSFSMYSIFTQIAGGRAIGVPLGKSFIYDLKVFSDYINLYSPKLIFLCSPNNPTGNIIPIGDVIELLENSGSIVVLDEAYVEFYGKSYASQLLAFPNAIILRTFSKAYGLAGLRVGYLQACEKVVNDIYKVKPPYNIGTFSQRAACLMLEHEELVTERISTTVSLRDKLYDQLKSISGITAYESNANFILVEMENASKVYSQLVQRGILVRNFPNNERLSDCLRISVGTGVENDLFITYLEEIMSGGKND